MISIALRIYREFGLSIFGFSGTHLYISIAIRLLNSRRMPIRVRCEFWSSLTKHQKNKKVVVNEWLCLDLPAPPVASAAFVRTLTYVHVSVFCNHCCHGARDDQVLHVWKAHRPFQSKPSLKKVLNVVLIGCPVRNVLFLNILHPIHRISASCCVLIGFPQRILPHSKPRS